MLSALFALSLAAAQPKLLVLDVEIAGAGADEGELLNRKIVDAFARKKGVVEVISAADVRGALSLEAQKRELGCDTDSCLSELAQAMGAEYALHPRLSRVGDARLLGLDVLAVDRASAVARETLQGENVRELSASLDDAVGRLVDAVAADAEVVPSHEWSALRLGGVAAGAVGVAGAVGLFAWAGALESTLGARDGKPADKAFALDAGPLVVAGGIAAAVVGAGGLVVAVVTE